MRFPPVTDPRVKQRLTIHPSLTFELIVLVQLSKTVFAKDDSVTFRPGWLT
jgi:hypothetical protein